MSERISEQALAMIEDAANTLMDCHNFVPGESAVYGALIRAGLDELRERRALDEHRRKSDEELIARRSRDLTSEEQWHLAQIRNCIQGERYDAAKLYAVLDKLLASRSE